MQDRRWPWAIFVVIATAAAAAGCGGANWNADGGPEADAPTDIAPPMDVALDGELDAPPGTCPAGTTMCGDACVDLQRDAAHCGACDRACPSGQVCVGGACCARDA